MVERAFAMTNKPLTTLEGEEPVWRCSLVDSDPAIYSMYPEGWAKDIVKPSDIIRRIRALQEELREMADERAAEIVDYKRLQEERNALEASVKECPDCDAYFPHHQPDCDLYVEMERFLKLQERVRELEEKLAKAARLYGDIHPDFRAALANLEEK